MCLEFLFSVSGGLGGDLALKCERRWVFQASVDTGRGWTGYPLFQHVVNGWTLFAQLVQKNSSLLF